MPSQNRIDDKDSIVLSIHQTPGMNLPNNKPNRVSRLTFAEDFRAACVISGLTHESVLQHFIDQMSICNSLTCGKNVYQAFPVEVVYEYANIRGKPVLPMRNRVNHRRSIPYLRQVLGIHRASGISRQAKRAACLAVTDSWYQALSPRVVRSQILYLNRGIRLTCSKDFVLLCELFEVRPLDILQYFTNQVSLPWARARIKQASPGDRNPALSFFIAMSAGKTGIYENGRKIRHPDIYVHFIGRLQELDLRLLFTRNPEERERAYRKLYRAWYKALLSANNPVKTK